MTPAMPVPDTPDAGPARPLPGTPQGSLDLLARAAVAPEPAAREAWRAWRAAYDIDATPWNEVRMLGTIASRIHWLEPDAAIRPRIQGIRKFLWVHSQMCLRTAREGLLTLNRALVPAMLMKGAARVATEPAAIQERLLRDIDVLVPLRLQGDAFAALTDNGWSLREDEWQLRLYEHDPITTHHAWTLSKDKSVIDLHHFSGYLNRLDGDDEGLWQRSRKVQWSGAEVHVPSPADSLLIALAHGIRWSQDNNADWLIDAAALLDAGAIDWAVFVEETNRRLLAAVAVSGLRYLRDALQRDIPADVMQTLEAAMTPQQQAELHHYATSNTPRTPRGVAHMAAMALQRIIRSSGIAPLSSVRELPTRIYGRRTSVLPAGKGGIEWPTQHSSCTTDWLMVTLMMDLPDHPPGRKVYGKFVVAGLPLGLVEARQRRGPHGVQAGFSLWLPVALFRLRMVRHLMFEHLDPETGKPPDRERRIEITWASVGDGGRR